MSLFRIAIVGWLGLSLVPGYAVEPVIPSTDQTIEQLLAGLPGAWDGRAIETPVGPVDYAISFHACDKGVVAGVAELDVSSHHWRFSQSDGELRLMFLSTFRGNQKPVQLVVSRTAENIINFYAPDLALLTLSVSLVEPHLDIRVFHYLKPHVHIRLVRSDRQVNEARRAESEAIYCKEW